tara:strand:+ start:13233 stop:15545 length:2313 start_codon:yes stop_codon:yes gene_type:complete
MTDSIEFLTGHDIAEFMAGQFSFAESISTYLIVIVCILLAMLSWLFYRRTTGPLSLSVRTMLIAMRASILVLLFLALLQPMLTTFHVIPQETYVALLIDDSSSMTIGDMPGGQTRGDYAADLVFSENGLAEQFAQSFQTRIFRFHQDTARISSADDLSQSGVYSSIGQSLRHAAEELAGFPLAGIVLISDGASNQPVNQDSMQAAQFLAANKTPVFAIGVGQESIPQDIEIVSVKSAKTVLDGTVFSIEIGLANEGYPQREVELLVEDEQQLVATKKVVLGNSGTIGRFYMEVTPDREDYILYNVRIAPEKDEVILENNQRSFLVDNRPRDRVDVLYVEGHPRNEYKFIQRALQTDPAIRLATYLQTGPRKFLRQNLSSPRELADGYPNESVDLYQYEAIIFGDIPATFFTADQLAMTEKFVAERGGGFLNIGVTEEAFIDTPIADLLPVTLLSKKQLPTYLQGGRRKGDHPTGENFPIQLTRDGKSSPLLRLAAEDRANQSLWSQLPTLQGIDVTGRAKPGALVLALHPKLKYQNTPLPVIATERYGRGRTMAITTASTWRWQMLLPLENDSHERLWRQILRWLTNSSPARVEMKLKKQAYHVGDPIEILVSVSDDSYQPENDATVWLEYRDPAGAEVETQLKWQIENNGLYSGIVTSKTEGIAEIKVTATSGHGELGKSSAGIVITASRREFNDAAMDSGLLRRIAADSGGRFYIPGNAQRLVKEMVYNPGAHAKQEDRDAWDMPIILAILILLFGLEWGLRRAKGLS